MARMFVAVNDSVHSLLRQLTRQVPLCPGPARDGVPTVQYQVRPEQLPDTYFSLAVFHALQGWPAHAALSRPYGLANTNRAVICERVWFFDAVRLDRRCSRDLRLKVSKQGPGMLSAEVLAYGTGTLRAANDNPAVRMHRYLWSQHGRLRTQHEHCSARFLALNRHSLRVAGPGRKESYLSTNVLYGDAYGELEQLWERRADTAFLDLVARSLQGLRRRGEPAAFMCPPQNIEGLLDLHFKSQALWRTPPASGRVLLRRLEYILENTKIDSAADTLFRWFHAPVTPALGAPESQPWKPDTSGYDGWLSRE